VGDALFDLVANAVAAILGKLPDCRMSFSKGFTQGGSNADIVIADAFVKNLTEGVDWKTAYEAVVSDAEGTRLPGQTRKAPRDPICDSMLRIYANAMTRQSNLATGVLKDVAT
jgi:putative alpha-1,2-mannosidase